VLVLDAVLLGAAAPWAWVRDHLSADVPFARGLVSDRLTLASLGRDPREDRPLVFVVGSSRVQEGFHPKRIQARGRHELHYVRLAHALVSPLEIRSMVPHLIPHEPALVVIGLSEFDTHSVLRPLPGTTFHSAAALADVLRSARAEDLFLRRHELYRVALALALRLYHYRDLLRGLGIDALRTFEPPQAAAPGGDAPGEALPAELEAVVEHFDALYPERDRTAHPAQVRLAWQVRWGPDADVHKQLVRSAIGELRAAGIPVLVVELPLFPGLEKAYDASTRVDFRDFMRELTTDPGVHFLPLAEQPAYQEEDFEDPVHLGLSGSVKLSRVVIVSSLRIVKAPAAQN